MVGFGRLCSGRLIVVYIWFHVSLCSSMAPSVMTGRDAASFFSHLFSLMQQMQTPDMAARPSHAHVLELLTDIERQLDADKHEYGVEQRFSASAQRLQDALAAGISGMQLVAQTKREIAQLDAWLERYQEAHQDADGLKLIDTIREMNMVARDYVLGSHVQMRKKNVVLSVGVVVGLGVLVLLAVQAYQ